MSYNPSVLGPRHSSTVYDRDEHKRCTEVYLKNETFRQKLRFASPHFSALERLYGVSVLVNRFQLEELRQCGAPAE